jgi:hypothetical protein
MANLKLKTQFNDLVDASVVENQIEDLTSSLDDYALKQQPAWITPTLTNGWATVGSPYRSFQYMKDEFGFVHIVGAINGASQTSLVAMTLPVGYRPLGQTYGFCVNSSEQPKSVVIDTTGAVYIVVPSADSNAVSVNLSFKVN